MKQKTQMLLILLILTKKMLEKRLFLNSTINRTRRQLYRKLKVLTLRAPKVKKMTRNCKFTIFIFLRQYPSASSHSNQFKVQTDTGGFKDHQDNILKMRYELLLKGFEISKKQNSLLRKKLKKLSFVSTRDSNIHRSMLCKRCKATLSINIDV